METPATTRVKVVIRLGSETYPINATIGTLSEQLVFVKDESMSALKDFITRHNVPIDVPDEPVDEILEDEPILDKSKKTKLA